METVDGIDVPKTFGSVEQEVEAFGQVALIFTARQETVAMEQSRTGFYCLVERQVLQTMQRVVMNKGTHGPEKRNRFSRHIEHCANFQLLSQWQCHDSSPIP